MNINILSARRRSWRHRAAVSAVHSHPSQLCNIPDYLPIRLSLKSIEVLISTVLREIRDERDAPALCADALRALETCGGARQAWNGARPSEQPRQAAFRTHPPPPNCPPYN